MHRFTSLTVYMIPACFLAQSEFTVITDRSNKST